MGGSDSGRGSLVFYLGFGWLQMGACFLEGEMISNNCKIVFGALPKELEVVNDCKNQYDLSWFRTG